MKNMCCRNLDLFSIYTLFTIYTAVFYTNITLDGKYFIGKFNFRVKEWESHLNINAVNQQIRDLHINIYIYICLPYIYVYFYYLLNLCISTIFWRVPCCKKRCMRKSIQCTLYIGTWTHIKQIYVHIKPMLGTLDHAPYTHVYKFLYFRFSATRLWWLAHADKVPHVLQIKLHKHKIHI